MNHSVRSLPFDWKDIGFDMATSSTARPKRVVVPPRRFGFTDDGSDDEPEHDDYDADPTEQLESDSSSSSESEESDEESRENANDNWRFVQVDEYVHPDHSFEGVTGWTVPQPTEVTGYISAFLPDGLFQLLCNWTNQRANMADIDDWKVVDVATMKKFFGLLLAMPLTKKSTIDEYWSTEPIMNTPYYATVMSRNQFRAIYRFLRFSDPNLVESNNRNSRLFQLEEKIHQICRNFKPGMELSLDECLLLHKGRLCFKMFIRSKRARFGIKIYILCDCLGYMLAYEIYYGARTTLDVNEPDTDSLSKSELVVVHLLKKAGLLDQWHTITIDNWYSSTRLAEYLYSRKTFMRGTVNKHRGIPKVLQEKKLPNMGISFMVKDDHLLAIKFCDRKDVYLLSTADDADVLQKTRRIRGQEEAVNYNRPTAIEAYNLKMGGVDLTDQYLAPYSAVRKSQIWFKKMGIHFLQRLFLNGFLRYIHEQNIHRPSLLKFTKAAIVHFTGHASDPTKRRRISSGPSAEITMMHFPEKIPVGDHGQRNRLRCKQCQKQTIRRDTQFRCSGCQSKPPLCITCFRDWHVI